MQTAVQYMDTGMVGVLGTSATAAVGATSTVNWLIGSTISAISIGFWHTYPSQSSRKKRTGKKASGQAVLTVVIVGIFFTILTMGLSRKVPVWMQVDPSIQKLASSYFDPLCTDAFSNCEHYFWNCPEGSGRYQNPYAGRSCL